MNRPFPYSESLRKNHFELYVTHAGWKFMPWVVAAIVITALNLTWSDWDHE